MELKRMIEKMFSLIFLHEAEEIFLFFNTKYFENYFSKYSPWSSTNPNLQMIATLINWILRKQNFRRSLDSEPDCVVLGFFQAQVEQIDMLYEQHKNYNEVEL